MIFDSNLTSVRARLFTRTPKGRIVCCRAYGRAQDLRAHRTRKGHHDHRKHVVTKTAYEDAELQKRKEEQKKLPHVKWGTMTAENSWRFKYLGSLFEAGGGCMADIKARISMARQRFGKLRHIWHDKELHINLRLRLIRHACAV